MIDFHSHFLPDMDDGSDSIETSLAMLHESWRQGVRLMFATPHFYAEEDDPENFLARRSEAYARVREAIEARQDSEIPDILLGAEIYLRKSSSRSASHSSGSGSSGGLGT